MIFSYTGFIVVTNVFGAVQLLLGAFGDMLDSVADTGELPEHPRLEALLLVRLSGTSRIKLVQLYTHLLFQPLKMSWQQEVLDLTPTLEDDTDEAVTMAVGQTARWFATCVHNIYLVSGC